MNPDLPSSGLQADRPSLRPDYSPERLANWLARHEAFSTVARAGDIDVAFFGDSLTDGWRDRGRAAWDRHFAPLRAANFGLSGDRTQQVLWRMEHGELEGMQPRAFVLLIGTNNLDSGLGSPSVLPRNSLAEILDGIQAIIGTMRRRFPAAAILLHGLLPRGARDSRYRAEIASLNADLRRRAEADPSLSFVDAADVFLLPDGHPGPALNDDLLHVSESGYAAWAEFLHEPVRAAVARGRTNAPPRP